VYGRLDRLFLKLYEEEREMPVTIFLDASESMNFGDPPKFGFARQVAAAIGYVALCSFDRVRWSSFRSMKRRTPCAGRCNPSGGVGARYRFSSISGRCRRAGRRL